MSDDSEEWICAYQITFKDGGEPEYGQLCVGSKESCDFVAASVPAIS